jgi:hypothetical protein
MPMNNDPGDAALGRDAQGRAGEVAHLDEAHLGQVGQQCHRAAFGTPAGAQHDRLFALRGGHADGLDHAGPPGGGGERYPRRRTPRRPTRSRQISTPDLAIWSGALRVLGVAQRRDLVHDPVERLPVIAPVPPRPGAGNSGAIRLDHLRPQPVLAVVIRVALPPRR